MGVAALPPCNHMMGVKEDGRCLRCWRAEAAHHERALGLLREAIAADLDCPQANRGEPCSEHECARHGVYAPSRIVEVADALWGKPGVDGEPTRGV